MKESLLMAQSKDVYADRKLLVLVMNISPGFYVHWHSTTSNNSVSTVYIITEPDDEPQCAQWERGDLEMLVTKIMQIAS